jgi:hypothetical protein
MSKEKAILSFVNSESEELFFLKEHALIGSGRVFKFVRI